MFYSFVILEIISGGQAEVGSEHVDCDWASDILDLQLGHEDGFIEGPDEALKDGQGHHLVEIHFAEQRSKRNEDDCRAEISLQELVQVQLDVAPLLEQAMPEASEEDGHLDHKHWNQVSEANGRPGVGLEEDHQEAETDEDHGMDILEDREFIEHFSVHLGAGNGGAHGDAILVFHEESVEEEHDDL